MVGGGVDMCDVAVFGVGDFARFEGRAWVDGGGVMLPEVCGLLDGSAACDTSGVMGADMALVAVVVLVGGLRCSLESSMDESIVAAVK
jgi:hypothetical protein